MDDALVAELLTRRDADQRVRRQVSGFVGQPEARVPDVRAAKDSEINSACRGTPENIFRYYI
jgi:hypothetical protein